MTITMSDEEVLFTAIKELGFDIVPDERDGINGMLKVITMSITPSIEKIVSLLTIVYSDPGAYCRAVVIDQDTVSYMEGNHGWTSKWKEVSIGEFATFVQMNWDKGDGSGQYAYCIHLENNKWGNPR